MAVSGENDVLGGRPCLLQSLMQTKLIVAREKEEERME